MARPAWTLTEAVQRTGASRSTLRRYQAAGKFPNAYKDSSHAWRFPLEDLLAVGLSPSEPAAERASASRERALSASSERAQSMSTEQATTASAEQVSKLEQALREERTRADNAERLAASYLDNVQDLRRALRMLEAGTSQPGQATERVSASTGHAQSTSTGQPTPAPATLTEPSNGHIVTNGHTTPDTTKDGPFRPVLLLRRLLSRL